MYVYTTGISCLSQWIYGIRELASATSWFQPIRAQYQDRSGPIRGLHSALMQRSSQGKTNTLPGPFAPAQWRSENISDLPGPFFPYRSSCLAWTRRVSPPVWGSSRRRRCWWGKWRRRRSSSRQWESGRETWGKIFQLKDESCSYTPEEAALLGLLIFLLPRVLDVHKGRVTVRLLDVGVGERTLVAEHVVVHRLLGGWKWLVYSSSIFLIWHCLISTGTSVGKRPLYWQFSDQLSNQYRPTLWTNHSPVWDQLGGFQPMRNKKAETPLKSAAASYLKTSGGECH